MSRGAETYDSLDHKHTKPFLLNLSRKDVNALLKTTKTLTERGRLVSAIGTTVRASGMDVSIGQQCLIEDKRTQKRVVADVVGLVGNEAILLPMGDLNQIGNGAEVRPLASRSSVPVGDALVGRVLNGLGVPLDDQPLPDSVRQVSNKSDAPNPLSRSLIDASLATGIRSIDAFLTVGLGQRIGIFAPAGGGKSTLLGMLARQIKADIVVIALIGERGREVREFLELSLGEEGRKKAILIVATSDRSPMERVSAAYNATAIAEGFRDQGKNVLLLMDSITRFARALREIGLSSGEPAVRQGYPPSLFTELPKLFERAGPDSKGTISAFYTVLVEDEDLSDPVAEEVRSLLDGHIMLSQKLARAAHYPSIDVLRSASRVFTNVTTEVHQQSAQYLRRLLALYEKNEFLIQVGEYETGTDPLLDEAINKRDAILALLQQGQYEDTDFDTTLKKVFELSDAK